VTLVGVGKMVQLALKAAATLEKDGIDTEVIDLRSIRPLDMAPVIDSVRKTHRAVALQEQWKPFGAAAEIAASIMDEAFDELDAPVERVTGADVPMPYARNLELLAVPSEEDVIRAVRRVMYLDQE
jgi:pyruvate dehydrogenase E1 component beta subunit